MIVFIRIEVRPEKRRELLQTLSSIVAQVKKEGESLHAGAYQDVENENVFLMVEEWATQKGSDGHLASEIFTVLKGARSLMRGPPEIVVHTASDSKRLEG